MLRRAWALHLGVATAYVLVAVAFTWPLALHLDTHLLGDPGGDTGVYVWNQWVFQHEALFRGSSPLTTERILSLSTRPIDLTQHNYTAFLDVLAMPLIPWLGVVATFNVVMLLVMALTGYMTFLYTRHVSGGVAEAWLAGLAFAFGPILLARTTGHVSLVAAAPLPAFLLALRRAGESGRLRDAALAGLAVAWAAFCDAYFAVYCVMAGGLYIAGRLLHVEWRPGRERRPGLWALDLVILLAAGLVLGLALGRGGRLELLGVPISVRGLYTPVMALTLLVLARVLITVNPRVVTDLRHLRPASIGGVAVATAVAALVLSPVLYGVGQQVIEGGWVSPPILWRSSPHGVDLLALVTPNPSHPLFRWLVGDWQAQAPTVFVEYTASCSLVTLAVIALAWTRGLRPAPVLLGLAAFWSLLALGPFVSVGGVSTYVPGPWSVLRYVPVVGLARMPTRFAIVAALVVSVLFAVALVGLGRQRPARRRALLATVAACLLFELWPAPRPLFSAAIPSLYEIVRDDPRRVRLLELPFGLRDGVSSYGNFSARYQFNQTLHGRRLIGGYLSRVSQKYVRDLEGRPVLRALTRLSARAPLEDASRAEAVATAPEFLSRADIGWVVVHTDTAPDDLVAFATEAFGLEPVARDGTTHLFRPTRLARPLTPGRN